MWKIYFRTIREKASCNFKIIIHLFYLLRSQGVSPSENGRSRQDNRRFVAAGDFVFHKGEKADCIYYLRKGEMVEETENQPIHHEKGDFIGEIDCILNQTRVGDGVALTDCKLLVFTQEEFHDLMQKSPKAAIKAISKISEATASLYEEQRCITFRKRKV